MVPRKLLRCVDKPLLKRLVKYVIEDVTIENVTSDHIEEYMDKVLGSNLGSIQKRMIQTRK